ncbi:mycofactocin biosynthesis glycosyltransferase MftF [Nocardioides sp.]|uniref:mycofactocin biosynthesis glycosyltransferase MftF n=1 Tax=Nocardioides sp. TaxID=35761 RepID=UPI003784162B
MRARLRPGLRRGDVLVGGSPMRVVRLKPAALAVLDGDVVPEGELARRLLDAGVADPVLEDVAPLDPADLTVVLPVHGRADELDRALEALRPLRCVVVDDASPVPLAPVAPHAEVLRLDENVGPAGARNAGLATVRTPYVAFVDCDVTVSAETLTRLGRHFADPGVAMVAPRILGRARSERPRWFERYDEEASSLGLGATGCSVRPGAAVAWLPSACLVARTDRLGSGFDPTMRVGEDVDLVWRLVDAGETVRYDPSEVAHHDARATLRGWLGRKYVYGTGGAPLATRHGDKVATAVLSPAMAVGAAALLLHRRWSVPVALVCVARGVQVLRRTLPDVPDRDLLAVGLAGRGLWWSVRQESALLLRHWWPAVAAAALVSRPVRRAVVGAVVVDVVVAQVERPGLDPVLGLAGRRLDDLAYGAGLWAGALRARSLRAVLPISARGAARRRPSGPATGRSPSAGSGWSPRRSA